MWYFRHDARVSGASPLGGATRPRVSFEPLAAPSRSVVSGVLPPTCRPVAGVCDVKFPCSLMLGRGSTTWQVIGMTLQACACCTSRLPDHTWHHTAAVHMMTRTQWHTNVLTGRLSGDATTYDANPNSACRVGRSVGYNQRVAFNPANEHTSRPHRYLSSPWSLVPGRSSRNVSLHPCCKS